MVQILLRLLYVPALEEALYRNHMVFEIMAHPPGCLHIVADPAVLLHLKGELAMQLVIFPLGAHFLMGDVQ